MNPKPKINQLFIGFAAFWTLYFLSFYFNVFHFDKSGALNVSHTTTWADWPAHFSIASAMATRSLFLTQSPFLILTPFRYPFLADLISAVLIKVGVPFFASFIVPSFFLTAAIPIVLYVFYREFFKSDRDALVAALIYLFNGGLGFLDPSRPFYTVASNHGVEWQSVIHSIILPQRAFQLGFPLALLVLILILRAHEMKTWIVAGLFAGLLPIAHAHSFFAVAVITSAWCIFEVIGGQCTRARLAGWVIFAAVTASIAAPLSYLFIFSRGDEQGFLSWQVGWYENRSFLQWLLFWLLNWGLTLPAAAAGWFLVRKKSFFAPFVILFVLVNLVKFQPWEWDNTKLLAWASVGLSALAGIAVVSLWEKRSLAWKFVSGALLMVIIASGAHDAYRIQQELSRPATLYTKEELELAEWVKINTSSDSVWLTGTNHNNWLYNLTGRQALMQYEGWGWTHGYKYQSVKDDLGRMFSSPDRQDLFEKYNVTYAVIGPNEVRDQKADAAFFQEYFPVANKTRNYTLYRTDPGSRLSPKPFVKIRPVSAAPQDLQAGLLSHVYKDKNVFRELAPNQISPNLNFAFNADEARPFPTPCSISWEGYLKVDKPGDYHFWLESDDGAWLYLNDELVIDNGGEHSIQTARAAYTLEKGYYRFKVKYFDAGGGAILSLKWALAGEHPGDVDNAVLFHRAK